MKQKLRMAKALPFASKRESASMLTLRVYRDAEVRELSVPAEIVHNHRLSGLFAAGFLAYQSGDEVSPSMECDRGEEALGVAYLMGFQAASTSFN